jgi:PAS domain S-box-containing protein
MSTDTATLQTLIELSPLATATLDMDGRVTRWNAAAERLLGWTSDEMVRALHPLARAEANWLHHQCAIALRTGSPSTVAAERPRRDASFVRVSVSSARTAGTHRRSRGFVALYTEDPFGRKPNGLAQLAAGIAHEMNTPGQYINDNLSFLRDAYAQLAETMTGIQRIGKLIADDADPATIVTLVGDLCRAAELARAEDLMAEIPSAIAQSIDGLRLVSNIVNAMKEFAPQPHNVRMAVDLNKAIATTMLVATNEIRYVADTHTVLDPELPPIWCVPGQINQVLLTLLTNAAHSVGEAARAQSGIGHVTVSTRKVGASVEIEVTDTGTGIPEALRPHIFDPFFVGAGAGLNTGHGLALAYATIVHQHGGRIWFESEVGKGSSFFVRLPLRRGRSDRGPSSPTE